MGLISNTHSIDLEAGSLQYLSAADNTHLSITGDLTIELWVKLESSPGAGSSYDLVTKYESTGDQRSYNLDYFNNSGTFQLRLTLSTDGAAGTLKTRTVAQTLSTGTWYHVAISYVASTGTATFYLDGSSLGTGGGDALPTSIFDSTAVFEIGSSNGGSNYFDGLIDDVRVWAEARSGDEISNNYLTEIDSTTNLKGSWHLDNALTDSSGNDITLTNNNVAVFSTDTPFQFDWSGSETLTLTENLIGNLSIYVTDDVLLLDRSDYKIGDSKWTSTPKSDTNPTITNVSKT